jgi:hypothetical protein
MKNFKLMVLLALFTVRLYYPYSSKWIGDFREWKHVQRYMEAHAGILAFIDENGQLVEISGTYSIEEE